MIINEAYFLCETSFFVTGSFMLFMHRLMAEAVRFSLGIEETLHFNLTLYIPSIVFIIFGIVMMISVMITDLYKERNMTR